MKRIVFLLFIIAIIMTWKKDNSYIIPDEAIRFRIIANSNSIDDQLNKTIIKEELEGELKNILKDSTNYEEASQLLQNNIGKIENIVSSKTKDYKINLGLNYFPQKEYKNVKYPKGYYNSLVITLGEGIGNNWWCVLYPPLCFIDETKIEDSEYSLFIKEIFSKITK